MHSFRAASALVSTKVRCGSHLFSCWSSWSPSLFPPGGLWDVWPPLVSSFQSSATLWSDTSRCRSIPKSWCLRDSMTLTSLLIRLVFSWRTCFKCWFCCSAYSNSFLPCSLHFCCRCWSYFFTSHLQSGFSLLTVTTDPVCKTTVNPPPLPTPR